MSSQDARSLPSHIQQKLRERALDLYLNNVKQIDIAVKLGVTRQAIGKWIAAYKKDGQVGLKQKVMGRPKGSTLQPWQCAQVVKDIKNYCPDDLQLPFFLWTRDAVSHLIKKKFCIVLSKWTVGRYLKKWGFSSQKPARRAIEQNPAAIENWLQNTYPAIKRKANKQSAEILWADEMGLRSDHQTGKTYGLKGKTPVVKRTGKRFSCNMISAISNYGTLRFMIFRKSFHANILISFLRRLIHNSKRKVFLILDQHPVHKSKKVKEWLRHHLDRIEIFYLPGYCPELNPDELLNHDVKSQALSRKRPECQDEMVECMISHLRMRQKQPHIIKRFVDKIYNSQAA